MKGGVGNDRKGRRGKGTGKEREMKRKRRGRKNLPF